jgi:hypothetical protein
MPRLPVRRVLGFRQDAVRSSKSFSLEAVASSEMAETEARGNRRTPEDIRQIRQHTQNVSITTKWHLVLHLISSLSFDSPCILSRFSPLIRRTPLQLSKPRFADERYDGQSDRKSHRKLVRDPAPQNPRLRPQPHAPIIPCSAEP